MSATTPQAAQQQGPSDAEDAYENQSPNRLQTQAGLKSVMKTASKAQRVPADINEDSPTPVRVLRNGKRVPRATPRLPRASRVELSPEGPKTLPRAHRVPVCQKGTPKPPTPVGSAGKQPAASPAAQQSLAPELQTPPAASFLEQLSSMTPQDALLHGAPTSPMALISSLQRPSSSARNPLMPTVSLHDSLPGDKATTGLAAEAETFQGMPFSAASQDSEQTGLEDSSMETPIPADAANIESQPEASVRTPEHTPVAPYTEDAMQTPEPADSSEAEQHAAGLSEDAVLTPEPADSSEAEQYAAGSVPTPRPGLSPRLADQSDYITPPPQILDGDEGPLSTVARELQEQVPDEASVETLHSEAGHEAASAEISSYVPRSKRTPFMERRLKALQAKEWSDKDTGTVHKSRLEREKEAAAVARRESLSSADRAAVRRLVQGIFARVATTQGKGLGETMVRHKSRLEREKEAAAARRKSGLEGIARQARLRRSPAGSSFAGQGLGDMKTHMSRLERDRAAVAVKKATGQVSPAVQSRAPGYMRQTTASVAMKRDGGLGENMKVHRSQLERDRETALALQAARKKAGHNPLTPYPVKPRAAPKPRLSFGSLGGGPAHKSKLEQAKDAATAAAAASPPAGSTEALPSKPPKPASSARATAAAGWAGLGDMKPHKSRLEREKEAWERQAQAKSSVNDKQTARQSASTQGASRKEGFSDYVPN